MAQLFAWVSQKDQGCDYTIGCANALFELDATDVSKADDEVMNFLIENHGYSDDDIAQIMILELKHITDLANWPVEEEDEEEAAAREERHRQYLALKQEFG